MKKKNTRLHVLTGILAFVILCTFATVNTEVNAQAPPLQQRLLSSGTTSTTLNTDTQVIAANTNLRYYLTEATCINVSASTVSAATIESGTTAQWVIPCPAASANGGTYKFDPPLRMPTINAAVQMKATTAATTLYFNVRAYTDK